MTAFSREQSKQKAIEIKIRRAMTQARNQDKQMKLNHAGYSSAAAKGDYTMLKKEVKEKCQKAQQQNELFRSKIHAK